MHVIITPPYFGSLCLIPQLHRRGDKTGAGDFFQEGNSGGSPALSSVLFSRVPSFCLEEDPTYLNPSKSICSCSPLQIKKHLKRLGLQQNKTYRDPGVIAESKQPEGTTQRAPGLLATCTSQHAPSKNKACQPPNS